MRDRSVPIGTVVSMTTVALNETHQNMPISSSPPRRPTVIAVANAKGGVGKTSLVANAAGIATLAGWRVLAIDLDPQGNLATDLGYQQHSDGGRSLATTLRRGGVPKALTDVRSRLDVWPGGPSLQAGLHQSLIPEVDHPLSAAIEAGSGRYDLVFIDCPPTLGPLVDAGLIAADWLLIPVRADHASLHGLDMMLERYEQVRSSVNGRLQLLGVALFDVSPQSTAIIAEIAEAVRGKVGGLAPLLRPPIRRSERSAFDMRRMGLLAHEYEERSADSALVPLAERIAAARRGESAARYSSAAAGLSGDYFELVKEVLTIVNSANSSAHAAKSADRAS